MIDLVICLVKRFARICNIILNICRFLFSFSAAFAAFVAGMACSVGIDFSAKLIASLARSFEV